MNIAVMCSKCKNYIPNFQTLCVIGFFDDDLVLHKTGVLCQDCLSFEEVLKQK